MVSTVPGEKDRHASDLVQVPKSRSWARAEEPGWIVRYSEKGSARIPRAVLIPPPG
jgi:hypothetical protein